MNKNQLLSVEAVISRNPSLFDEAIDIQIKGLLPSSNYTLYSKVLCEKNLFECFSHYISNDKGCIDLTTQISHGGFYKGIEPMGLFWGLQCISKNNVPKRLMQRDVSIPIVVTITIYKEWLVSISDILNCSESNKIMSFQVTRLYMAPGVRRIEVNENGLLGTLFLPPGKGPFPGLINMFGGMPGTLEYKPALFASHGFASLALPYSGIDGLPETILSLEMEYFEKAVRYLQKRDEIAAELGLAVVGICKGGQVAFSMADCLTGINCVIAINAAPFSAHSVHQYKERVWKDLFNDNLQEKTVFTKSGRCITRYAFPFNHKDPAHQASLFDFHKRPSISYMYITGLDDDNVPSDYFANYVEYLLKSENHPNYQILRYPGAGHLIEAPYSPHVKESYFRSWDVVLSYGGTALPHCHAQEDAWKKQLEFLRDNLCRSKTARSKL